MKILHAYIFIKREFKIMNMQSKIFQNYKDIAECVNSEINEPLRGK